MMNETFSELLVPAEVAQWLRIKSATLYAWAATGKIPSLKLNGTIRFIRSDVERWLRDCSNGFSHSDPSTTRPIVPIQPTSVSRHAIQQAGLRAIRGVVGQQSSQPNVTSRSLPSKADSVGRKDTR